MDLDDSTIENMCSDMAASMEAVERHEVEISAYQRLTFVPPAMICCCCILVLVILSLAHSFSSCSTFFDCLNLNSVLHPLVERTSEDYLDGMLDVL